MIFFYVHKIAHTELSGGAFFQAPFGFLKIKDPPPDLTSRAGIRGLPFYWRKGAYGKKPSFE